ncbi:uncharacterized mitochondrial protein AtMg00820-like [Arachis duranensis]|uniref:Uncharacterized mitochondrial protein AtMg00820-like n=1 Tax=Arachis duranensis TaxID=130453 RepID=A0A6P4DNF0_ARADU|nr:uncharacterized mitochondrial protein AtMg00820-like [Arachis duranensis]
MSVSTVPPSKYPLTHFLCYNALSASHRTFSLAISTDKESRFYEDAVAHATWRNAIKDELDALQQLQTWEIQALPPGKKPIGCKWVFKLKHNLDGSIERRKTQLVAKGFTQVPSIDYLNTFSPVLKLNTLHVVLALTASKGWFLK